MGHRADGGVSAERVEQQLTSSPWLLSQAISFHVHSSLEVSGSSQFYQIYFPFRIFCPK